MTRDGFDDEDDLPPRWLLWTVILICLAATLAGLLYSLALRG